jgi:hypothetical protein
MDTLYRKKEREALKEKERKEQQKQPHVADDYNPKLRPRESHPDAISAETRIAKNLNKLNRQLVETPIGEQVKGESVPFNEDRGAKVVTMASSVRAQAPLAIIFTCALVAVVFMYMLSLYIQVDEYSHSIDEMKSEIAQMKEETTKLEIRLEGKYDLNEVERMATEEFGMVAASSLPKKYISISEHIQASAEISEEKSSWENFWDTVCSWFGTEDE